MLETCDADPKCVVGFALNKGERELSDAMSEFVYSLQSMKALETKNTRSQNKQRRRGAYPPSEQRADRTGVCGGCYF